MIRVDAIGDACPIPVVKTKNAIKELKGPGEVEILVDNEIAVQNLKKMADQKGYSFSFQKPEEGKFKVNMIIGEGRPENESEDDSKDLYSIGCKNTVIVIGSDTMGSGSEELGAVLIKGFIYALAKQEQLPKTILFYNGGAKLTCEGSDSLEDLRQLEAAGVNIMTCGTCLNFYGLTDKLGVGSVTNMYVIVETITSADLVIKP